MLCWGHVADTTWVAQIFPDNFIPRCHRCWWPSAHSWIHLQVQPSVEGIWLAHGMPPLEGHSHAVTGWCGGISADQPRSLLYLPPLTPASPAPYLSYMPISASESICLEPKPWWVQRAKEFTQTRNSGKAFWTFIQPVVIKYLFWPGTISGTVGTIAHKADLVTALTNKRWVQRSKESGVG